MTYFDERSRVFGCLALALFVTGMLALVSTCVVPGPYTSALPRPFNSNQWKAADTWSDTRCSMLADLTHRIGVVGKTQAELYRLPGKPQSVDGDPPPVTGIYAQASWTSSFWRSSGVTGEQSRLKSETRSCDVRFQP